MKNSWQQIKHFFTKRTKPIPSPVKIRFAGFSDDGTQFAWISPAISLPDIYVLHTITIGETIPEEIFLLDENHQNEQIRLLKKQGFSTSQLPIPKGIDFQANLTEQPAWIRLFYEGRSQDIVISPDPFPPSDQATLWGISANGKYIALSVSGPDVPGLFSDGTGAPFQFFFILPKP